MKTTYTPPFADTPVAQFLMKRIDQLAPRKTQREIAFEAGYEKPNILSMFKTGQTKVPIEKVPALAKALEVDPAMLLRMVVSQMGPGFAETFAVVLGDIFTSNEVAIIKEIREITEGEDPALTPDLSETLRRHFETRMPPSRANLQADWSFKDIIR